MDTMIHYFTGTIGSQIPPYDGCMQVELVSYIINGVFQLADFGTKERLLFHFLTQEEPASPQHEWVQYQSLTKQDTK